MNDLNIQSVGTARSFRIQHPRFARMLCKSSLPDCETRKIAITEERAIYGHLSAVHFCLESSPAAGRISIWFSSEHDKNLADPANLQGCPFKISGRNRRGMVGSERRDSLLVRLALEIYREVVQQLGEADASY